MPQNKSIYRRPDAQHFQLVHRSQRDPLIHDPDASQHVLKPFSRENDIKKVRGVHCSLMFRSISEYVENSIGQNSRRSRMRPFACRYRQ